MALPQGPYAQLHGKDSRERSLLIADLELAQLNFGQQFLDIHWLWCLPRKLLRYRWYFPASFPG